MKRWFHYAVRGEIKMSHATLALPPVHSRSVCLVSPVPQVNDAICRPIAECKRGNLYIAICIAHGIKTTIVPISGVTRHAIPRSPIAVVADAIEVQPLKTIRTDLAVSSITCVSPVRSVWPLSIRWGTHSSPFDDLWQEPGTKRGHFIALGQRVLQIISNRECNLVTEIEDVDKSVDNRVRKAFVYHLRKAIEGGGEEVRWGADCADALRLRAIVNSKVPKSKDGCAAPIEWSGSLKWLGGRLLETTRRPEMTPIKLPVYTAAIASRDGYSAALEWAWNNTDDNTRQRPEVQRSLSLLGLRVILSSYPTETASAAVTLPVGSGRQTLDGYRWSPLEIATYAMVSQRREVPLSQWLAKLMSEEFVKRLRSALPAYSKKRDDQTNTADLLYDQIGNLIISGWRPWSQNRPSVLKGFNFGSLENRLASYIGTNNPEILWPLCCDSILLTAVMLGLAGNPISGIAQLAVVMSRSRWRLAVQAVKAALSRRTSSPGELERWVTDEVADSPLRSFTKELAALPDPNVLTGTPVWVFIDGRSNWTADLIKDHSVDVLRTLRTSFRSDLIEKYEPYWLLTRRHKKAFFSSLRAVKNMARYPSKEKWRAFADKLARQAWEKVQ